MSQIKYTVSIIIGNFLTILWHPSSSPDDAIVWWQRLRLKHFSFKSVWILLINLKFCDDQYQVKVCLRYSRNHRIMSGTVSGYAGFLFTLYDFCMSLFKITDDHDRIRPPWS